MIPHHLKFPALLLAGVFSLPAAAQDPVGPPPGDPDSVPADPLPPEDETFEPIPPTPDSAPVDDLPPPGTPAEVIERDAEGRATRVRANGVDYDVCADGQVDGCINPREAGLDFGDEPLDTWPDSPASETEPSDVGP